MRNEGLPSVFIFHFSVFREFFQAGLQRMALEIDHNFKGIETILWVPLLSLESVMDYFSSKGAMVCKSVVSWNQSR